MALKKIQKKSKKTILCFGEVLVDIFGSIKKGFDPKFGGAPANTAVWLKKLGYNPVAFAGKVGADFFGEFLKEELKKYGVETRELILAPEEKTTLAFVVSGPKGQRDFSFMSGAHETISQKEVKGIDLKSVKIMQFGSLTQANPVCAKATDYLLKQARAKKVFIAYDPNVRLALWPNPEVLKKIIFKTLARVDSLKLSDEELKFLTGTGDLQKGVKKVWRSNLQLLIITRGEKGAYWKTEAAEGKVAGRKVKVVDTTGAGDAFNAGILAEIAALIEEGKLAADEKEMQAAVAVANKVAARSTLKKGAV